MRNYCLAHKKIYFELICGFLEFWCNSKIKKKIYCKKDLQICKKKFRIFKTSHRIVCKMFWKFWKKFFLLFFFIFFFLNFWIVPGSPISHYYDIFVLVEECSIHYSVTIALSHMSLKYFVDLDFIYNIR